MVERVVYEDSTEFVVVTVDADVELSAQTVQFSFDGATTWLNATWMGDPGMSRKARLLLTPGGNMPPVGMYTTLVKVGAGTEVPVMKAGVLRIKPTV